MQFFTKYFSQNFYRWVCYKLVFHHWLSRLELICKNIDVAEANYFLYFHYLGHNTQRQQTRGWRAVCVPHICSK